MRLFYRQNSQIGPLMVFLIMSSGRRNIGSLKRSLNTNSVGSNGAYLNYLKNILKYYFDALDRYTGVEGKGGSGGST